MPEPSKVEEYAKPEIVDYGSLQDLTATSSPSTSADNPIIGGGAVTSP